MSKNKGILGAVVALAGIAVYLSFYLAWPQYYPKWYWSVPVFFFLNACLFGWLVASEEKSAFSLRKHLLLKMLKTFGALLLLVFYFVFEKANTLSFILVMGLFYLLYTFLETKILLQLNKRQTRNESGKK